jgi:hypothetical protein
MLLHVYMFTGPLVIGAFLTNPAFGTFLSTASVLGFFALNKTAEELEGARPSPNKHRRTYAG